MYTSGDRLVLSIQPATCFFTHRNRNYLAVFGGSSSVGLHNRLFLLDMNTYEWREVVNSKAPRLYGSTINYDNGNLYILGGSDLLLINPCYDVIRYNIDKDEWEIINISNRPDAVTFFGAVIYKDNLYNMFGLIPDLKTSSTIYKLGLSSNSPVWEKLPIYGDVKIRRASQAYAFHQGKVYLFGGAAGVNRWV